ncbi:MAG: oligoribonuclease [Candidatus Nanopelagicales bacterium]
MAENRLVWIDCEMTGLDLRKDELVEVAAVVTDSELNELDAGIDIVIRPVDLSILDRMEPVVVDMHTDSGLLADIPAGVPLATAEAALFRYISSHVPEARKAPLAGSSVYVDRGFLSRFMPTVDEHLHYRLIDVSSIKELARRWYPRAYFNAPAKTGGHRALADIRESIAELRFYRAAIFSPEGPSSEDAKAIAADHVVDHARSAGPAGP